MFLQVLDQADSLVLDGLLQPGLAHAEVSQLTEREPSVVYPHLSVGVGDTFAVMGDVDILVPFVIGSCRCTLNVLLE